MIFHLPLLDGAFPPFGDFSTKITRLRRSNPTPLFPRGQKVEVLLVSKPWFRHQIRLPAQQPWWLCQNAALNFLYRFARLIS
jgi:hypothetical protein